MSGMLIVLRCRIVMVSETDGSSRPVSSLTVRSMSRTISSP
jgi:hypothetical protein